MDTQEAIKILERYYKLRDFKYKDLEKRIRMLLKQDFTWKKMVEIKDYFREKGYKTKYVKKVSESQIEEMKKLRQRGYNCGEIKRTMRLDISRQTILVYTAKTCYDKETFYKKYDKEVIELINELNEQHLSFFEKTYLVYEHLSHKKENKVCITTVRERYQKYFKKKWRMKQREVKENFMKSIEGLSRNKALEYYKGLSPKPFSRETLLFLLKTKYGATFVRKTKIEELPLEEQEELLKQYKNGNPLASLSTNYGISQSSLRRYLARNNALRTVSEACIIRERNKKEIMYC